MRLLLVIMLLNLAAPIGTLQACDEMAAQSATPAAETNAEHDCCPGDGEAAETPEGCQGGEHCDACQLAAPVAAMASAALVASLAPRKTPAGAADSISSSSQQPWLRPPIG